MNTKQLHVRIESQEGEILRRLSQKVGISQNMLASMLAGAAIRAAGSAGKLALPLEFQLVEVAAPPAAVKGPAAVRAAHC